MNASACPRCGAELRPGASPAGLCPACLLDTALTSDPDSDGFDPLLSETLAPGTTVGPFRIVGVLGRGGMATVYEAYDERLERAIALKVLPPELLHAGVFARRFEGEGKLVASLEHPNIVPIYASGIDKGIPWMSMRLLAGGNMGSLLRKGRPDVRKALSLLRSVADALDYAHAHRVVHRDIKPTNILLDVGDCACVGDFGLAKWLEDSASALTRTGTLAGTPQYMAPELALGNTATYLSDIYSLGIVAYETFVGALPFTAESPVAVLMKHVREPLPAAPDGRVPPAMMRAIERAAAKDPGDRWPSAGAFVTTLAAAADPVPYEVITWKDHVLRRRAAWTAAAGSVLVAAATVAWFVAQQPAPVDTTSEGRSQARGEIVVGPPENKTGPVLDVAQEARATKAAPVVDPKPADVQERRPTPGPVVDQVTAKPPDQPETPGPIESEKEKDDSRLNAGGVDKVPPPSETETNTTDGTSLPPPPPADVVTTPIIRKQVAPYYPDVARAAKLEGDVLVQATVGVDGRVSNVQVLRPVHPLLDEAARRTVLQYEYTPGRRNGIPEAAEVPITVQFTLD